MIDDKTTRDLATRFGATRLCLWCLCGNKSCRRARTCQGDPRRCTGLLQDWLAAIDEEKRVRGKYAPPERELKTLAEVRAYLAWRKALPAEKRERGYPMTKQEEDRMRYDLARRLTKLTEGPARGGKEREEALKSPLPSLPGLSRLRGPKQFD